MKLVFSFLALTATMTSQVATAQVVQASGYYNCHYYQMWGGDNKKFPAATTLAGQQTFCGKTGYLAVVTSDGENDFIANLIKDIPDYSPWLGGKDDLLEGTFYWLNGEPWSYTHWGPGQPDNNFDITEEDCVQLGYGGINPDTGLADWWNDLPCTEKRPYMVEYDCECPDDDGGDGGANGDPHIKTWSGEMYDFHGICDLVLLKNPEFANKLGMDVHIRTKQTLSWSYISAAVLRIGEHTLEVTGAEHNFQYFVDGKQSDVMEGTISGYSFQVERSNSQQYSIEVTLDQGSIILKTFKNFVRVDFKGVSEADFGSSVGLMGTFQTGDKIGRDKMTVFEDVNEFGHSWQVLPSEGMLFHDVDGPQAPEKCMMPQVSNLRRRLGEKESGGITEEVARIACAHANPEEMDLCIFDVMATTDLEVAGAF